MKFQLSLPEILPGSAAASARMSSLRNARGIALIEIMLSLVIVVATALYLADGFRSLLQGSRQTENLVSSAVVINNLQYFVMSPAAWAETIANNCVHACIKGGTSCTAAGVSPSTALNVTCLYDHEGNLIFQDSIATNGFSTR